MAEKDKEPEKPKNLATKLSEVMGEVQRIAKRGRNDFHKYDYATESDITAAIREHLASRRIVLLPRVKKWTTLEKGGEKGGLLAFVEVSFTLLDGDSGETFECDWLGCGEDKGDKAIYKAFTGALKYFLMKLFLIPTGDDPEREGKRKKERPASSDEQEEQRGQAQPMSADAAAILLVAAELSQIRGKDIDSIVTAASKFTGKDGTQQSFSASDLQNGREISDKWLQGIRGKLERALQKEGAMGEPGASEAAALFTS